MIILLKIIFIFMIFSFLGGNKHRRGSGDSSERDSSGPN